MDIESNFSRLLKLFQGSIRAAGLTQTHVDGRIGRRRGYLSHVFQRRVDLKVVDLLRALEVLEVDAARFFQVAFSTRGEERSPVEDLMQLVSDLPEEASATAGGPRAVRPSWRQEEDAELLQRVREIVRIALAEHSDEQLAALGEGRSSQPTKKSWNRARPGSTA